MKRLKRWQWALIGVVVTVVLIGVLIWKFSNHPSSAVINNQAPAEATATPTPGPLQYQDKYISYSYPSSFKITKPNSQVNDLDQWRLLATEHGTTTEVNATITTGALTDDPSYTLRRVHPEIYTLTTRQIGGETVTLSTNHANGNELVIFWPHNGELLTFAITGSVGNDALLVDLNIMINSMAWIQQ